MGRAGRALTVHVASTSRLPDLRSRCRQRCACRCAMPRAAPRHRYATCAQLRCMAGLCSIAYRLPLRARRATRVGRSLALSSEAYTLRIFQHSVVELGLCLAGKGAETDFGVLLLDAFLHPFLLEHAPVQCHAQAGKRALLAVGYDKRERRFCRVAAWFLAIWTRSRPTKHLPLCRRLWSRGKAAHLWQ